jgi:hypothetical protein
MDVLPVVSDPSLLNEIRRYGTFDSAACYQCGSCTLSCDLVSSSASFPRKSIRYALLGLRRSLLGSLEPWICHDCGDCSIVCPRHAEPRISMATLRRFLTAQYDWSGIASKLLQSKAWYLGSLIGVTVLTFVLILGYHLWYVAMPARDFVKTSMGLEHMFPIIFYYTLFVILVPMLLLLSRIHRVWLLTMKENHIRIPLSDYAAEAWMYVYEAASQPLMRKCPQKGRWLGHWLLAAGTVLMLAIKTFGLRWFQTDNIYAFYNPQRWLGYLAAVFILYGVGDILLGRWRGREEIYKETKFHDLVFPVLAVIVVLTGLAAHIFRYTGIALGCHYAYALHIMAATPLLLVEMSFGKWSHMLYRPLALYFLAVKERVAQQAPASEALPHAI